MVQDGDDIQRETDEARGGSTPHIVRWILVISTLAAIVALSVVWMTGAALQGDVEDEASVSSTIQELEEDTGADTDGIVSDEADEFGTEAAEDPLELPNQAEEGSDEQ